MANFNLQDYEPVQDRITKFYAKYPEGRIITDLTDKENGVFVFKATLYKSGEDLKSGIILSTGWAREVDGKGYVNQTSALENCETSAIGRALANIGLHGDKRPSREEMQKSEKKDASDLESEIEKIMIAIDSKTSIAALTQYQVEIRENMKNHKIKGVTKDNVKAIAEKLSKAFDDKRFELSGGINEAHK